MPKFAAAGASASKSKKKKHPIRTASQATQDVIRTGSPAKHDWSHWRRLYIRDEQVSLTSLAAMPGAPSESAIKRRSSAEDWPSLRADLNARRDERLKDLDADVKTEYRLAQIKLGKAMIHLGVRGMANLDPQTMTPIDQARFIKLGSEMQRKALGLDELTVRVGRLKGPDDLDSLSEAELWQIAGMVAPKEGEEDDF